MPTPTPPSPNPPIHAAPAEAGVPRAGAEAPLSHLQHHLQQLQHAADAAAQQMEELLREQRAAHVQALEDARLAALREAASQRQSLDAEFAELRRQREQLESDRAAAADLKSGTDDRAAELDRRADQLRDQVASLRRRTAELLEIRKQLRTAAARLADRQKQLTTQARASVERLRRWQARKSAELDQLRQTLHAEAQQSVEKQKQQLDELREQWLAESRRVVTEVEQERQQLAEQSAELAGRSVQLDQRQAALAARRRRLGSVHKATQRYVDRIRQDLEREVNLTRAAVECEQHRRREELEAEFQQRTELALRQQDEQVTKLQERAASLAEQASELEAGRREHAAQMETLENQRRHAREVIDRRAAVMETQQLLAEAEQRMIRRWGIHQAFSWAGRGLVCLLLCLAIGYQLSSSLATRVYLASAAVRQLTGPIGSGDAWLSPLRARLTGDAMLGRVAIEMRRAGYAGPTSPAYLRTRLASGLSLSSPAPGMLHMELTGNDPQEIIATLDALAQSLASITPRLTTAVLSAGAAAPVSFHVTQPARLAPRPIRDNQLQLNAIFFAAAVLLTIVGVVLLSRRAARNQTGEVQAIDFTGISENSFWQRAATDLKTSDAAENVRPIF